MKKTQLRVFLKNIWATKVSFFSILLFVALGIAIFLGIKWNQPSFNGSADGYYNEKSFYDFTVSFPYGITDDDIKKIEALDSVSLTEGGFKSDGIAKIEKDYAVLAILSVSEKMNIATVTEGRIPASPNEIGIERGMAKALGLGVGDILTIHSERGGKSCLVCTDFTVTAIVEHPAYISLSTAYSRGSTTLCDGEQDYYALVSESAFNKEAYDNCYSDVYIRSDSLRGLNSFSSDYLDKAEVIAAQIEELGSSLGLERYTAVTERYKTELEDAEIKIKDAEVKLSEGEAKLKDAEAEISELEKKISDGEKEFAAAEKELADGEKAIADAKKQISDIEKEIADGKIKLTDAEKLICEAESKINSGEAKLVVARRKYAAGEEEYRQYVTELAVAKAQIQTTCKLINGTLKKINTAYLKMPQDLQDMLNGEFSKYGINPMEFRLSDEPAELKKQMDTFQTICKFSSLIVDGKASLLESLKEQIEAYNKQYGNAPDSAEKQAALEKLHKSLKSESVDNQDIGASLNAIKYRLSLYSLLQELLCEVNKELPEFSSKLDEYIKGEKELEKAYDELRNASAEISFNAALLENYKGLLNEKIIEFESGKIKLDFAIKALNDGKKTLSENITKLEEGKTELESSRAVLTDGKTQLEAGKTELFEKKAELEDSKAELADKKSEYLSAKTDIEKLTVYDSWQVNKRSDNFSYSIADAFSKSGKKLCYSLSLLFVFVGVMVCYTAISRIVREQQVMTGVQKSLGFRRREIMAQYLSYAGAAVALGSVFGAVLGYFVIEPIMNHSFAPNFLMGEFKPYFRLTDLLLISGAEFVLIGFSAWLACHKLLEKQAVALLRGNEDSIGRTHFYEKFHFWNKLSLYTQTTINNLFCDRTRVIATLVGVAGCTSLIVMAMTVQMSLNNTPVKHFSEVSAYDRRLISNEEIPGAMDSLSDVLKEGKVDYTEVYQKSLAIENSSGEFTATNLIIPSEPTKLSSYIRLIDKTSGKAVAVPAEGVIVSDSYAKYNNLHDGDSITLVDMEGNRYFCEVVGITNYYLSSTQVVMSFAYYEKLTGVSIESNAFLINLNGTDAQELDAKLKDIPGYFDLSDDTVRWTAAFKNFQSSVSLMVCIALFLSAVMALLVILNLNIVLISEKSKELIVMRINGFSVGDAKKYIYRDNIVLTLVGTLIGIAVGIGIGALVIFSLISKSANLLMTPSLPACLAGAAVSIVFSLITNLIALKRVGKLKVSDLNK